MKPIKSIRHAPSPCPFCGYRLDAVADPNQQGATPSEGDASLCFNCAGILFFKADLTLRAPAPGEVLKFAKDSPDGWKTLKTIQANLLMQMHNQ